MSHSYHITAPLPPITHHIHIKFNSYVHIQYFQNFLIFEKARVKTLLYIFYHHHCYLKSDEDKFAKALYSFFFIFPSLPILCTIQLLAHFPLKCARWSVICKITDLARSFSHLRLEFCLFCRFRLS